MPRESYIEQECRKIAVAAGCKLEKWAPAGTNGKQDRILLCPGGVVAFVEFKRPGEDPTPLQDYRRRELIKMGFEVYVIDSVAEFRKLLSAKTAGRPASVSDGRG